MITYGAGAFELGAASPGCIFRSWGPQGWAGGLIMAGEGLFRWAAGGVAARRGWRAGPRRGSGRCQGRWAVVMAVTALVIMAATWAGVASVPCQNRSSM